MTTVVIFTYNRKELLKRVLSQFKGKDNYDVWILDDGSLYDKSEFEDYNYIRLKHSGKRGFADKWADAFYICQNSDSDRFMFLPDDFVNIDFKRINYLHKRLGSYAVNMFNCGRTECWTSFNAETVSIGKEEMTRLGFVDCGFVCDRAALASIGFSMPPVSHLWHNRKDKSSGVGYKLSHAFLKAGVKMYTPVETLCDHIGGMSVMHPEGNPVIDRAILLNLDEREDKLNKFLQHDFPFSIERFPAIKKTPGWLGCRDSHFEILEEIEGVCIVMEDDMLMLEDWDFVYKAMKQLPSNWDLLYLGATLNQDLERYSDNLYHLKKGWTTHAIIYNDRYVPDFVLEHKPSIKQIDVFYADVVQENFNCFVTYPMAATQRPGYSDVINREVDYNIITQRYEKHTS